MDFRLTYAGRLLAHTESNRLRARSLHVHEIRKHFHKQLKVLWGHHPALLQIKKSGSSLSLYSGSGAPSLKTVFAHDGFNWLPMATEENGLICKVEILMLRYGPPGQALFDIDNRLKTLFDALRKAKGPNELGAGTAHGQLVPDADENPFYVVLEDDRLITHLAVTTDALLEPIHGIPPQEAVRIVVNVTINPYRGFLETVGYV